MGGIMQHTSIELLNETEAAEILRVGVKTLQAWRYRGSDLTYRKVGRLVYYTQEDIEKFLATRARKCTREKATR